MFEMLFCLFQNFTKTFDLAKDGEFLGDCTADNITEVVLYSNDDKLKFVLEFEPSNQSTVGNTRFFIFQTQLLKNLATAYCVY